MIGNRRFAAEPADKETDAARTAKTHAADALAHLWHAIIEAISGTLDREYQRAGRALRMRELCSAEPPHISVLTSLAAGADQIGARTALQAAATQTAVVVDLEALLPFSEENYPGLPGALRPEFRPGEADELRSLALSARQVVRLAGSYADVDGRRRGYEEARDLLLQNSDILIAVYDPRAEGSAAGTAESVGIALGSGMPVIAVLVTEEEARIVAVRHQESKSAIDWDEALAVSDGRWRSSVESYLVEQLVLPELLFTEDGGGASYEEDDEALAHALRRLAHMTVGHPPAICANETLGKLFGGAWSALHRVASAAAPRALRNGLRKWETRVTDDIVLEPYASFYARASALSAAFMRTYRGAFVLSYFLTGLAVAAAVAMMAVAHLMHEVPHAVMWFLCVAKILILLVLLLLQWAGHRGRWQEAAADYRYLAELLRPMQWLTPIGTYPPAVELPLHATRHDPRRSWMAWLVRAVARTSPPVSSLDGEAGAHHPKRVAISSDVAADALDRARMEWIEGQVVYHARTALRMRVLEKGLERIEQILIGAVLFAAVVACALELSHVGRKGAVLLGALAAVLPAFIAAVAGVAFQSEAKRLATRYEAMYRALRHQQHLLNATATRLRLGGIAQRANAPRAMKILKDLSAITIAEASDWKVLYQVHEIHAG